MQEIEIRTKTNTELDEPVLVEGLPGAGLVGTLGVTHIVDELEGTLIREIYSEHFPPFVSVNGQGEASLDPLEIHAFETSEQDLLVLSGPVQSEDSVGQYRLAESVLDIAEEFNVSRLFALGGSVMGNPVNNHDVVGSVAEGNTQLKKRLEGAGVEFQGEGAPETVGGVSGLLLGLSEQRNMEAALISGTIRSGFTIDAKATRVVLEALEDILKIPLHIDIFVDKSNQKKESVRRIQKVLQMNMVEDEDDSDGLRYFG